MAAGRLQGGGLHRDARSRHRLGRRRSRHQCRRAQGREPPHPAHRPRQPPARRAVARHAGAGQPLRGARMPRRASTRPPPARRTRRCRAPAPSTCWPSTCSAWPAPRRSTPTSSTTRSGWPRPIAQLDARGLRCAWSISSRTAATRCGPTSASPRSARARTGAGASPTAAVAQQYRLNVGTIVEADHAEGAAGASGAAAGRTRPGPARRA